MACALLAAVLTGCSSGPHVLFSGDVGAGGGRVSTPDGSVAVALGSSSQNVSTSVTISTPASVPDPPSYVRPVGGPVQVDVSEQRSGSVISLRFDPASDLPAAQPGAPQATVANAFIAVYSTDVKMWVPLTSTWEPQSHMLTAVTPHFSLFQRFVVNPGKAVFNFGKRQVEVVASATTTGVELFTDAVRSLVEFGWAELNGAVPEDERAACPPDAAAVPGISATVAGSAGAVAACVASDDGQSWLRIQNNLGIAVDVSQIPPAFGVHWNPYDERAFDDLFYLFGYAADREVGWQLVPPRSSVEVQLPTNGSPAATVLVRPNYLMVVVDVVTTLLSVLPATAEIDGPVLQQTKLLVGSLESAIGAASTREQAVTVLRDGITTELQPDGLSRANAIVDFYNCLLAVPTTLRPSTEAVVSLVRRCGKPIIDGAGHELAGILLGAVGALRLPNELADFAVRGQDTWGVNVVDAEANTLASSGLTVDTPSLTARVFFGQLASLQSALASTVTLNIDPAFAQAHPDICAGTVVFTGATGQQGAVYALNLGSGWGAGENVPDQNVQTDRGVMHQQVVTPPSSATAGTTWHASADLIVDGVTDHSGSYDLTLTANSGEISTWNLNGATVSCSSS